MKNRRQIIDDRLYAHFVTFSIHRRRRLLDHDHPKRNLLGVLNALCLRDRFIRSSERGLKMNHNANTSVRSFVFKALALSATFSYATAAFCKEPCNGQSSADASSQELSPEVALIVADHLTRVVRQLRDGGPPVLLSDADRATWSLTRELRENPEGLHAQAQYLDDYRRVFLESWCEQLRNAVFLDSDGQLDVVGGNAFKTRCFDSRGATNGHYDGESFARDLLSQVPRQPTEQESLPQGATARRRGCSPYREAVLYLVGQIAGEPSKKLGRERVLGHIDSE